jgi:hypothetical protein
MAVILRILSRLFGRSPVDSHLNKQVITDVLARAQPRCSRVSGTTSAHSILRGRPSRVRQSLHFRAGLADCRLSKVDSHSGFESSKDEPWDWGRVSWRPLTEKAATLYDQSDELNCRDWDEVLTRVYTSTAFSGCTSGVIFSVHFLWKMAN